MVLCNLGNMEGNIEKLLVKLAGFQVNDQIVPNRFFPELALPLSSYYKPRKWMLVVGTIKIYRLDHAKTLFDTSHPVSLYSPLPRKGV